MAIGISTTLTVPDSAVITASSGAGPVAPVQPAAPTPSGGAGTGQSLPSGGQTVPQPASAAQLGQAVDEINQFLRANARQFVFQLDSSTGKSQVTVVNPQTGEIIRQIPEPHALQLAQNIAESGMPLSGLLMDTQA